MVRRPRRHLPADEGEKGVGAPVPRQRNTMGKRLTSLRAQLQWVFEEYRLGRLFGLLLFLVGIWLAAAVVIWVSERSSSRLPLLEPGDKFYAFSDCLWCSTVYLVSGLEDFDPVTLPSKVAAVMVMVVGVGVLGLTGAQLLATFVERRQLRLVVRRKPSCTFSDHIVLCGWNERAPAILEELRTQPAGKRRQVVVVTPEALTIEIADRHVRRGVWGVPDDPVRDEALRRADVATAHTVVLLPAPSDPAADRRGVDARSILVSLAVAAVSPKVEVCVELADRRSAARFRPAPGLELLNVRDVAGKLIAHAAQKHHLGAMFHHLLSAAPEAGTLWIVPAPDWCIGMTFRQVRSELIHNDREACALLGLRRPAPPQAARQERTPAPGHARLVLNPGTGAPLGADAVLVPGDQLVVLARRRPVLRTGRHREARAASPFTEEIRKS